ncbi:polysaccharide deacetylase family protein [Paremcibacter congregatus]|uniref:Glycosyltransferase n=1 Tax=Paremcibacter congregatus TaxID=2043170 RepID=A0A2G4YUQ0_9PROT|nr:polysaccharide deacetylase family protein [Paremcibacter congregatus]PHZ86045.1 glycosyltransferase [Paremcibacter congregatus]QDE27011.1 glycosyltransferase [Paremcibacter congregatus]
MPKTPTLTVVIDTEEEFDWAAPFDRESRSVDNIGHQHLAQTIFRKYDIVPTYCIDYPVVENQAAVAVLKNLADKGECLIGTHLHPWVSPPYEEEVNRVNSYAGNLPYQLEKDKLSYLTDAIEKAMGTRPTIFKAGRYGAGPHTAEILSELGYLVDCSVVADTNFSYDHGPNFIGLSSQPYWFEGWEYNILELPNTRGYDGLLARWGSTIYPRIAGASGLRSLMAGVLVKSGLLERIPLTPEGIRAADQIRMVRRMTAVGKTYFNYAYHSSSLMLGGAPYVKTAEDLDLFLADMDQFFDFFLTEFGGQHKTPLEMHEILS